jgi:hypothetical protein
MARAAPRLSPEIITVRMPRAFSAASASRAPGLGSSPKASSASTSKPLRRAPGHGRHVAPSLQRQRSCASGPALASALASPAATGTPSSCIQRRLPMCQVAAPCTSPSVPRPGTARTPSGGRFRAGRAARRCHHGARQRVFAAALHTGHGRQHSRLVQPPHHLSATSRGWPTVSVPVLSNATVSTRCASSSACASLIRMPCFAATPVPAMMAAGVASPSAQGQAITSTATARISAAPCPHPCPQPAQQRAAPSPAPPARTRPTPGPPGAASAPWRPARLPPGG